VSASPGARYTSTTPAMAALTFKSCARTNSSRFGHVLCCFAVCCGFAFFVSSKNKIGRRLPSEYDGSFAGRGLQGLLAKSCLCRGFSTLVSNLITSSNIEAQVRVKTVLLHFAAADLLEFQEYPLTIFGHRSIWRLGCSSMSRYQSCCERMLRTCEQGHSTMQSFRSLGQNR
jgi:hypothetical protein